MRALSLLSIALLLGAVPAQGLRHAVRDADVVVVATQVSSQDLGEHLTMHRLQVRDVLKGSPPAVISVVHVRGVCAH